MTIFLVYREADKKFMGGYVNARAIFELPPDTYKVCVAEEDKITACTTITLDKNKSVGLKTLTCRDVGYILPEECPPPAVTRVYAKLASSVRVTLQLAPATTTKAVVSQATSIKQALPLSTTPSIA